MNALIELGLILEIVFDIHIEVITLNNKHFLIDAINEYKSYCLGANLKFLTSSYFK
jgi:hypothetical protein